MYWLITAYDVMDELHLTARCIGSSDEEGGTLEPLFHRRAQLHLPRHLDGLADTLKWIAEELNDLAYADPADAPTDHR